MLLATDRNFILGPRYKLTAGMNSRDDGDNRRTNINSDADIADLSNMNSLILRLIKMGLDTFTNHFASTMKYEPSASSLGVSRKDRHEGRTLALCLRLRR